jgi:hypothetical protein
MKDERTQKIEIDIKKNSESTDSDVYADKFMDMF